MTANKWADPTPSVPFGGLHGSGNDKTQFERIVQLERDLAAAQERIKSLEEHSEAIARTSAAALRREAAAQSELASVKAENSKLRSALSIVHFKQEPWQ